MRKEIRTLLVQDRTRFQQKGLFGESDDSLSMRVPGTDEFLLTTADDEDVRSVEFNSTEDGVAGAHAAIYRTRADAGAILIGTTRWSSALARLGTAIPTLFDEQARHIGRVEKPVETGRKDDLLGALQGGANIAIYGNQRVCVGTTPDRVVFNAELFEKCAKAFVIAASSGQHIRKIPGWVCFIAGGRLRKDQKRSAASYAAGQIPQGMNAY